MSGIDTRLDQAFQDLIFREGELFTAEVKAVDKKKKGLTVEDAEGIKYPDVRLTATLSEQDKIALYPKVGSSVLVARIGGSANTLYCIACSEVEAVEGKIEDTHFLVDKDGLHAQQHDTELLVDQDGFHLDRKGKNLYETLEKLFEQVQKLCEELSKVVVSVGTTVNIAAVNQIKQNIQNAVKQELNEILKPHKEQKQR